MATLSVQSLVEAAVNATYASAAELGDKFANDNARRTFVHIKNAGLASITATFAVPAANQTTTKTGFGSLTKASLEVVVPASGERFVGPFYSCYNDTGGFVNITYSEHENVSLAVLRATGE
jgi:hypothetical protein